MRIRLKKLLLAASFGLLLAFGGCSYEGTQTETTPNEKKLKWNTRTFEELKQNKSFLSAYEEVSKKLSERNSLVGRSEIEDTYKFTIDSTSIYEVTDKDYTSYTFGIISDNLPEFADYYENLFIEIDSLGQPQASLLKFNLDIADNSIKSIDATKLVYKPTSSSKILFQDVSCTQVSIYYVTTCGCPGHHWPGDSECYCPDDPATSELLGTFTTCTGGGGGGGGSQNPSSGHITLSPQLGGGNSSSSNPRALTNPQVYVNMRRKSLRKNYPIGLNSSTPNNNYNWFTSQSESVQGAIYNYLESQVIVEEGFISTATTYPPKVIQLINHLIEAHLHTNIPIEDLIKLVLDMDKECQADIIVTAMLADTDFTDLIKNNLLAPNNRNLQLSDVPSSELPSGVAATTLKEPLNDPTYGRVTFIEFSEEYLSQATDLGIVVTAYHELLHAYLIDLYHQGTLLTVYPSFTSLNTAMSNYYANPTTTNGTAFDNEIHNVFTNFIDILAQSVTNYCSENNISGVDFTYAKKLVWGSLYGTNIFNNTLTPAQKTEAQTLIGYENFNYPNAKGGKSCN